MAKCSWKIEENKKSSSDRFLKVKPDCKLKIRLIDYPVKVVKIFSHDRRCAVIESEDVGRRLKEQYPHKLSSISVRYACWCIDRDSNTMRILDMPKTVARTFGNRQALAGKGIAGIAEGCDWSIITNGQKGKDVRYEVVYLEETPLTYSEQIMVEVQKSEKNGHFDLMKIFKSCSFKDAEDKLFG